MTKKLESMDYQAQVTNLLNNFMDEVFPDIFCGTLLDRIKSVTNSSIDNQYSNNNKFTHILFSSFYSFAKKNNLPFADDIEFLQKILISFLNLFDGLILYEKMEDYMRRTHGENYRKKSYNASYAVIYVEAFIKFYEMLWDKRVLYISTDSIVIQGEKDLLPSKIRKHDELMQLIEDFHYTKYANSSVESERSYMAKEVAEELLKRILAEKCWHSITFQDMFKIYSSLGFNEQEESLHNIWWKVFNKLSDLSYELHLPYPYPNNYKDISKSTIEWSTNGFLITSEQAEYINRVLENSRCLFKARCKAIKRSNGLTNTTLIHDEMQMIKDRIIEFIRNFIARHRIEFKLENGTDEEIDKFLHNILLEDRFFYQENMEIEICIDTENKNDITIDYILAFLTGLATRVELDNDRQAYIFTVNIVHLIDAYLNEMSVVKEYDNPVDSPKILQFKPSNVGSLFRKYRIIPYDIY